MVDFASALGGLFTGLAQGAEAGISLSQKQQQIDIQKEQSKLRFLGAVNTLSNLPQSARQTFGPAIIKGMETAFGTKFPEEYKAIFLKGDDEQNKAMFGIIAKTYQTGDFSPDEFMKAAAGLPLDERLKYFKMATEGIKTSQNIETRRELARSGIRYVYDDQGRRIGAIYDRSSPGTPGTPATPATPGAATPALKMPPTPSTPLGSLPEKTDDEKAAEVTGLLDTANRGPQIQPEGVPRSALAPKPTTIPLEMDKAQTVQAPLPAPAKPAPPPISSSLPWVNRADWSKTGDEFAQQLPAPIAGIAKAIANYDLPAERIPAAIRSEVFAAAKQINPDLDTKDYAAAQRMRIAATSGQIGQTAAATRTAFNHMASLAQAYDAMQSPSTLPIANSIINSVRKQTGQPQVGPVEVASLAVGTEVAKALRGAGALSLEEEIRWAKALDAVKSNREQFKARLGELRDLILKRFSEQEAQYQSLPAFKGKPLPGMDSPEYAKSRAFLDKWIGSSAATPPPGGPKIGTIENGYRFKGGNPGDPKSWEKVQ